MSKKNKIIWGIFIGVSFVAFLVMYYFFFLANDDKKPVDSFSNLNNLELVDEIDPIILDQNFYGEAIDKNDIELCERVQDVYMHELCKRTLIDIGYYNQAVKQFNPEKCEKITAIDMRQACVAVAQSGVAYLEENDPVHLANTYAFAHNEKAIDEYEKILETNPDEFYALLSLALAYAEKGLTEQGSGGSQDAYVKKAFETIDKAKIISAENSEVFRVEAYINEIVPDLFKAVKLYDKAIALDSKNALAFVGRGHTLNMIGFLDLAMDDFNEAAKNDPDKKIPAIYSNLCRLAFSDSNLIEIAQENCSLLIKIEDANHIDVSQAHQILASIMIQKKDYGQAEKNLLAAKILNPNDPNLYVTYANFYLETTRPEQALAEAEHAISLAPKKAVAYYYLAKANYMLGDFDKSNEASLKGLDYLYMDESLLAPSKNSLGRDLYYMLANSYDKKGDSDKALEYVKMGDDLFLTE